MILSRVEAAAVVSGGGRGGIGIEGEGDLGVWGESGTFQIEDPPRDSFVYCEKQPELVYQVIPEYPRLSRELGIEGVVHVQALVGVDGKVKRAEVYVSSGDGRLDDAAVEASLKYRFTPALQNGNPIPLWVTYQVVFTLGQ